MAAWADDRLGPGRPAPAAADGRAARVPADHAAPRSTGSGQLAPFGIGNPKPTFWTPGGAGRRRAAADEGAAPEHEPAPRRRGPARASSGAPPNGRPEIAAARDGLDVAYSIEQNTFNGTRTLEVSVADVRASESPGRDEMAAAAPDRDRRLRRGVPGRALSSAFRAPETSRPGAGAGRVTREDPAATAQSTSGTLLNLRSGHRELQDRVRPAPGLSRTAARSCTGRG